MQGDQTMSDTENASTTDPADPPVNQPGGKAPQPTIESDAATAEDLEADPPESQSGGG